MKNRKKGERRKYNGFFLESWRQQQLWCVAMNALTVSRRWCYEKRLYKIYKDEMNNILSCQITRAAEDLKLSSNTSPCVPLLFLCKLSTEPKVHLTQKATLPHSKRSQRHSTVSITRSPIPPHPLTTVTYPCPTRKLLPPITSHYSPSLQPRIQQR